ncbi:hypothetical protein PG997_010187 [Apiospora hydei]|uniref:Uncharacterized protein n=1 Tax=Apiospora hydei TaxID=1337664 RepID=A0ABR1VWC4_9PEZI
MEDTQSPMPPSPYNTRVVSLGQPKAFDPAEENRGEGRSPAHRARGLLWQWSSELLMCFLIFGVPFVALGTLLPYHGKPLPQWPYRITINSLLSVYSTALKAAIGLVLSSGIAQLQWAWFTTQRSLYDVVRYDEATRGPWGSLRIIWAHRLRQPLTALGALVMVLIIAVEPFVQQILRTVDCSFHLDHERATIPRANVYGDLVLEKASHELFQRDAIELRSAIFDGVGAAGTMQVAGCGTGNCTFPPTFATMGLCHECHDVSDQFTIESSCVAKRPYLASQWNRCPGDTSISINSTLRLGDLHTWGHFQWPTGNRLGPDPQALFSMTQGVIRPTGAVIRFMAFGTPYSEFKVNPISGQQITGCESNKGWPCQGHGAAECTISPCVKEYSATVEGGQLKETFISKSSPIETSTGLRNLSKSALLDAQCLTEALKDELEQRQYFVDPGVRWHTFNVSQDNQTAMPIYPTLLETGCLYYIPEQSQLLEVLTNQLENFGPDLKGQVMPSGLLAPVVEHGSAPILLPSRPTKDELEKASREIGLTLEMEPRQYYQLEALDLDAAKRKPHEKNNSSRSLLGDS